MGRKRLFGKEKSVVFFISVPESLSDRINKIGKEKIRRELLKIVKIEEKCQETLHVC